MKPRLRPRRKRRRRSFKGARLIQPDLGGSRSPSAMEPNARSAHFSAIQFVVRPARKRVFKKTCHPRSAPKEPAGEGSDFVPEGQQVGSCSTENPSPAASVSQPDSGFSELALRSKHHLLSKTLLQTGTGSLTPHPPTSVPALQTSARRGSRRSTAPTPHRAPGGRARRCASAARRRARSHPTGSTRSRD